MLALDILPLSSSEVLLDPRLDAVLGDGFQELRGCVVLAGLVASAAHVTVSSCGDETGFEAFVNHVHVEDVLGLTVSDPRVAAQAGGFTKELAAALERIYPDERFVVILSLGDSCTVRFHKLREGQAWLADDLEGYDEAVMVVSVPVGR